jgi:hypothetical protein
MPTETPLRHTPGPWITSGSIHWPYSKTSRVLNAIWGPPDHHQRRTRICIISRRRKEESDANARLIASAPELLTAVHELLWHIGNNCIVDDYKHTEEEMVRGRHAVDLAYTVIAKAEGRKP